MLGFNSSRPDKGTSGKGPDNTFATTALQNGVDIKTVSAMPGALRRRFHAPHLHARHPAGTGRGGNHHG